MTLGIMKVSIRKRIKFAKASKTDIVYR
jgi:hypothetical protein